MGRLGGTDPQSWPKRVEKHYQLVPTICFNCESACGLLAYVNKATGEIEKFEGNPKHPASRGRLCAKGPATINQIHDPDRILYPMKRSGPRGAGNWTRTSWPEVLQEFGVRIRKAIQQARGNEVMYHVGRPGHDFIMDRTLQAWGIDGHNSHTNVCSSSARLGYLLWHYADRPSPDHANARFILLLSAHLESGHYFNPHAQRIIEGKMAGAKLAVMDPRLSNTASMADYWLPTYPGTESAVLLAMAKVILDENRFDAAFVKNWTNWQDLDIDGFTAKGQSFESAIEALKETLCPLYPAVRRKRKRSQSGSDRQNRARDRRSRQPLRLASVARQRLRQSWWMADGASSDLAARAHWLRGHRRRPQSERVEQVRSQAVQRSACRRNIGTSFCIRANGRCARTRCHSCCPTF